MERIFEFCFTCCPLVLARQPYTLHTRIFAATLTQTQEYSPWDQPKCLCDMGNSTAKIICRFHGHLVVGGRNIKYEIMAAGSLLQNYISEIKGIACQIWLELTVAVTHFVWFGGNVTGLSGPNMKYPWVRTRLSSTTPTDGSKLCKTDIK